MGRIIRGDLSGQTFGRNHVIKLHSFKYEARLKIYLCRDVIDGTEHLVAESHLWPPEHLMWQRARERAREKNKPFGIKETDIVIPEKCPIFGYSLFPGRGSGGKSTSPSVDCLVPDLGYMPGNIWVISWRANNLKKDATTDELHQVALITDAKKFLDSEAFQQFAENYLWGELTT